MSMHRLAAIMNLQLKSNRTVPFCPGKSQEEMITSLINRLINDALMDS